MGQGRLLGLLPHGSRGYSTADLPPLCPVLPGTGVLQVCSASGTISMAVPGAELQAQGAEPTEVPVVQEQGHHSEVPQSCPTSCQSSTSGGWRVSHSVRAQPGCTAWGPPASAQGATCTCVPCAPRPGLLLQAQQLRTAPETLRGDRSSQPQLATDKFCQKKQKNLGVRRTGDTALDTVPSSEQRGCRGSGTCQAVCEGQS